MNMCNANKEQDKWCAGGLKQKRARRLSPARGSTAEIEAALESWIREITDLVCYQPEVPLDHKTAVVEAFSKFRKTIGKPLREP